MTNYETQLYGLITAWEDAAAAAAAAKLAELNARKVLTEFAFPDGVKEGVNDIALVDGRTLKVTGKKRYEFISDDAKVNAALERLRATDAEGAFIATRLAKHKTTLAVGEFKKLAPKLLKIVEKVVKVSAATPEVEVVRPKEPAIPA